MRVGTVAVVVVVRLRHEHSDEVAREKPKLAVDSLDTHRGALPDGAIPRTNDERPNFLPVVRHEDLVAAVDLARATRAGPV